LFDKDVFSLCWEEKRSIEKRGRTKVSFSKFLKKERGGKKECGGENSCAQTKLGIFVLFFSIGTLL